MNFMYFLANLLGPLMKLLYGFIGNYGITIIVATVVMKLLLFLLNIVPQCPFAFQQILVLFQ